ncbi:AraC family transcriptional regulator [Dinghuibacter silviterrae]|uniref:AraC family transcriptional regulator n=1 Tax=Dinghuibacter silviterrae TaxID=1539049 RepID=A0A4R8DNE2_9BACT|nr:AraC family transcriptional regulator [Dinghuibacter silviterrae]TDW99217.1 AraC family transcriptional regulator [Dinghuibacter silviterrae]
MIRPSFEDIDSKKGSNSYLAYRYGVPFFPFQWHYHPEYELTLILEGSGVRMVGDSHEHFSPGDLVLLGPNLPHTWVSESTSAAVVIQFSEAFIGPFLQYPECDRIRRLLTRSNQGVFFQRTTKTMVDNVCSLPTQKGVARITALLEVLQALASASAPSLASPYFQPARGRKAEGRINKVCQYIQKHSSEDVSLQKIASLVHLSESAFCKFFKRTTGKTFSDYVVEIRLGHACHLLSESDDPISEIAYRSGFDSLSYFNRVFLRKKGLRPREFRKGVSGSNHNNDGGKVPLRLNRN